MVSRLGLPGWMVSKWTRWGLTAVGVGVVWLLLLGGLMGCQSGGGVPMTSEQRAQATVTQGCGAFGKSLKVLAAARAQGKLSQGQVAAVDQAVELVAPVCLGEMPTGGVEGAEEVLRQMNGMLEGIIFGLAPAPAGAPAASGGTAR